MEFFKAVYDDLKMLFWSISKNDVDIRLRIFSLAFTIILIVVVLPVLFNFLAIFELNSYLSLYEKISSMQNKNEILINGFNNVRLPLNNINSFMFNLINISHKPIDDYISVLPNVYYIGFSFKYDVFRSVFLLNNIIFIFIGVIFSVSQFEFKINNIVYSMMLIFSVITIILFTNYAISSIISMATFFVVNSLAFTKIFIHTFSVVIHYFLYKKLLKIFNCRF